MKKAAKPDVCRKDLGAAEPGNSCLTTPGTCESCPEWARQPLVEFTVPLVPPSVNHYKMQDKRGWWFVSNEAVAFKEAVGLFARGRSVKAEKYELEVTVYLGYRQRGDGDNFWKVVADALVENAVIHSDAFVSDWIMRVRRDRDNPRTEIKVSGL